MHYDRISPTWPSRQHIRPGRGCSQEEPVGRVSRRRHPTIRGWMRRVRPSDYAPLIRPTTAFTGDPTGGTPSRWTPVLWQTPDWKINHARPLIISMLDIPAPSHTPSPLPDTWERPHDILGRHLFRIIPQIFAGDLLLLLFTPRDGNGIKRTTTKEAACLYVSTPKPYTIR